MEIKLKIIVLVKNELGDILMLKEKTSDNSEPKWNFIKGTYDDTIETIIDCCTRECKEEANIIINNPKFFCNIIYHKNDYLRSYYVFLAQTDSNPEINTRDFQSLLNEDIHSFTWMNISELGKIKESEMIHPIIYQTLKYYLDASNNKSLPSSPVEIFS